jgi:formate dehydrogenase subunit delta
LSDHSASTLDRLIYMANQIGKYFASQKSLIPAEGVAHHLAQFWDPSMRSAIIAHLDAGGAGLDPLSMDAVKLLAAYDFSRPGALGDAPAPYAADSAAARRRGEA